MGMLMHHTWEEQQKQKESEGQKTAPVAEPKEEETVTEPVKRTGGRRKTTK